MSGSCNRPDCDVSKGLLCEMGHREVGACPHYRPDAQASVANDPIIERVEDSTDVRLPWTGRALGLADVVLAASRSPARLIGLIAPFNAGKTGLLTAIFAHLAQKGQIGPFDFAGSFSLQAWNQLKEHTTWPSPSGGMFPPHTADTGQRTPGLLHLAFRKDDEQIRDLLFTDAPGEWFTRWLTNESAENAAGARWIASNATHFIFVVDRAGLAGEEVGRVRQNTLALARRLAEQRRERPVVVAWTKSDGKVDLEIEAPIRNRLDELFGAHASVDVHVHDPACLNLVDLVLKERVISPRLQPRFERASAFLAYEGSQQTQ